MFCLITKNFDNNNMPLFNEPKTLKKRCILVISQHWDRLCYGVSTIQKMNEMIENDEYLSTDGPFHNMRKF